jgi:enterochelin esterase-like enzyme
MIAQGGQEAGVWPTELSCNGDFVHCSFLGIVMATNGVGFLLVTGGLFLLAAITGETQTQKQTGPQLPPMPKGFDSQRENIARGNVETVEYHSKTTGAKRNILVYTPPAYAKDSKYPVLYLLHGAKYNETSWTKDGNAALILDNLYADNKIVPMVVVMPNGHVSSTGDMAKGVTPFESELLNDVMPLAESRYAIQKDADHRALAGFSMGGGQSLPIGLKHLDKFAWVAGFSPAIQAKANLVLSGDDAKKIKLFYLACGDADSFFGAINTYHVSLEKAHVPHVWNVFPGGQHNFTVWKNDLYQFSQLVFKDVGGRR